jgi:hypothetical protein
MVSGADGKEKSLRIAQVDPIARRAAELLPGDRPSRLPRPQGLGADPGRSHHHGA